MTVLDKVLSKMQKLPTAQQQQVLHFIDFLAFELGDRQVNQNLKISKKISQNLISGKDCKNLD